MMFLAHFSGDGITNVLNLKTSEIFYWHNQAVELWNEINDPPKQ